MVWPVWDSLSLERLGNTLQDFNNETGAFFSIFFTDYPHQAQPAVKKKGQQRAGHGVELQLLIELFGSQC